jgi:hypothetical protein
MASLVWVLAQGECICSSEGTALLRVFACACIILAVSASSKRLCWRRHIVLPFRLHSYNTFMRCGCNLCRTPWERHACLHKRVVAGVVGPSQSYIGACYTLHATRARAGGGSSFVAAALVFLPV